jgi:deoxyribodipyrimidine photo-lyase
MAKPRILIWYRNDLRLHDHEPLHRAIATGGEVLPLYCFDPRQWATTASPAGRGMAPMGGLRAQFTLESVADLRQNLQTIGGDLLLRKGLPETVIPQLCTEYGVTQVYYSGEVTRAEIQVEGALQSALDKLGVKHRAFWTQTLYHPDDLPMPIAELPELFTHFRQQVEAQSSWREPLPAPTAIRSLVATIDPGELPELADFGADGDRGPIVPDERAVLPFQGGETAGLARLDAYLWQTDNLRTYKETRNGMLGADYSSKFSPWLAVGSLSPRQIAQTVRQYEIDRVKNDSTYWLIFELLWRDYFRFIAAKHGDRIFQIGGLQQTVLPWQQDTTRFALWKAGQTGYPLVDANMRELALTGFMSNRGRQNVASFLTKNLGIDWRWGATYFETMLIDYDVCSNWGNWNYAAGVGNDARGFRWFNITKQSQDYDRAGCYIKHWCPELADMPPDRLHQPWHMSAAEQQQWQVQLGVDYPWPVVDLGKSAAANERIYNQVTDYRPSKQRGRTRR